MARDFATSAAKRAQINLIVGMVGPSGGGKTLSAILMAEGIQSVTGGDIEMIDTEHGRGLFYAEQFKFNHTPFEAPFASLDYLSAIQQAAKRAKVIIVDSLSHEHDSEGGMIDYQQHELHRMAGDDHRKQQAMQMLAWAKPKAARRKLLQGLTQVDAHLILCFRAKNSTKPAKDRDGKSIVVPMGFVPIAGEEFVFESALSMLFHPNAGGVPTWNPDMPGERIAVKLPAQFKWLADKQGPITRQDGARLAEWARGSVVAPKPPKAATPQISQTEPHASADAPSDDPSGAASDYADRLEYVIDIATDARALSKAYNETRKVNDGADWAALKKNDPERAAKIHARTSEKIAELKELVGA